MSTLYNFGNMIEAIYGSKILLILYLTGSLTSGLFSLAQIKKKQVEKKYYEEEYHLGASGAILSLIAYFILKNPNAQLLIEEFYGVVSVNALFFGINLLYDNMVNLNNQNITGISHIGHLGGLFGGAIVHLFK